MSYSRGNAVPPRGWQLCRLSATNLCRSRSCSSGQTVESALEASICPIAQCQYASHAISVVEARDNWCH